MALLTTLDTLRPLVRSESATERVKFIGDDDIDQWVKVAWWALCDLYIDNGMASYFEKETYLTSLAPAMPPVYVQVPADFYRLTRVDYIAGQAPGQTPIALPDLDTQEVPQFESVPNVVRASGYRLRGSDLQLLPLPPAGQTYRLVYVKSPNATMPVAGSDSFDVIDLQGQEYVVLLASIVAVQKQKEDAGALVDRAMKKEAAILAKSAKRTVSRLGRIMDVASRNYEDPFLAGFPTWRRGT